MEKLLIALGLVLVSTHGVLASVRVSNDSDIPHTISVIDDSNSSASEVLPQQSLEVCTSDCQIQLDYTQTISARNGEQIHIQQDGSVFIQAPSLREQQLLRQPQPTTSPADAESR